MRLDTIRRGGVATVVLSGEVDAAERTRVAEAVRGLLDQGETRLVFDCEQVTFMGSTGIGSLLAARKEALARSGAMALVRPSPILRKVIRDLGLDAEFPSYGSREEAEKAVGPPRAP